ncbi:MAG: cation diffusion facilitator family transporter [Desulfomonile sp.]|nr:cation diffusion facilitator family transporter [Desulfomonile sp.]
MLADSPSGREPTPTALSLRRNLTMMLSALGLSVVLMGVKFYGYFLTGSSAILSDALESIINVVAHAFAAASAVVAARPPDESHPYGHGKIEFFSAGFEGALILLAAAGIFREGLAQVLSPRELPFLDVGLAILAGVSVVNFALGVTLVKVGKNTRSLVLQADGKHILTDAYTSAGVLVGLALVYTTGWTRLDGVVACLVGVNILFTGTKLVRASFQGLMDASDPTLLEEICDLLARYRKDLWIDVHRLRAWRAGTRVHVDFHLIVPNELPLAEGHREVKELEAIFSEHFHGEAEVLIHLDPCSANECEECVQDPCGLRTKAPVRRRPWNTGTVTGEAVEGDRMNANSGIYSGCQK